MTTQVKPGTRCECREAKCPATCHVAQRAGFLPDKAVRMVTVGQAIDGVRDVYAFCAICAEYHETGA